MSVSYKKLWKLLIDKDMKKKDLCEKAGISPASVTKMGRNGHVTTEILVKICAALDCGIEDIIEIVPFEKVAALDGLMGQVLIQIRTDAAFGRVDLQPGENG